MFFEREGMNRYMVISCGEKIDGDSYANSLLTAVEVPYFMNYEIREVNGEQSIYYKLKYQTSLKQVLGDLTFTRSKLEYMLRSIVDVLRQTEDYLLCQENILWNSNHIFIEVNTGKLTFTYYPGEKQNENALQSFLMELIQYVDKGQQQAYMYIMEFYNTITNQDCSLDRLTQCVNCDRGEMDDIDREDMLDSKLDCCNKEEQFLYKQSRGFCEKEATVKEKSFACVGILMLLNIGVVCCLFFGVLSYQYIWVLVVTLVLLVVAFLLQGKSEEEDVDRIMKDYQQEQVLKSTVTTKDEQVTMNDQLCLESEILFALDEETSVLVQEYEQIVVQDYPKETYLKTKISQKYSDLYMKKNSMVMGSMKDGCDYQIRERGISRMHAKVLKKEDGLYLLDMNSTNGTYINGEQMDSGKEYLLEEGDVISLAKTVAFVVAKREVSAYK